MNESEFTQTSSKFLCHNQKCEAQILFSLQMFHFPRHPTLLKMPDLLNIRFTFPIFAHSWRLSLPFITVNHTTHILTEDNNTYA